MGIPKATWLVPRERLLVVLALATIAARIGCFNVDVSHPVIFRAVSTDPTGQRSGADTMFGYTVALTVSKTTGLPSVIVGAPKANSTLGLRSYRNIREPGVIYKCPVVRGGSCQEVLVDPTGNDFSNEGTYRDLKDEGWLGGSMDAEVSGQGRVSVCSYRWRNQIDGNHNLGNGACYISDNSILDGQFTKIVPLTDYKKQFTPYQGIYVYMYSYGEMGTSLHFTDNGGNLLMGAPGVFDWAGTVVKHSQSSPNQNSSSSLTFPRTSEDTVLSLYDTPGMLNRYDYFGYSVSSGVFFKNLKTSYLIGAPRAEKAKGKVFLLDSPSIDTGQLVVHAERVGTNFGEYFGAAVLAVDLNGDGICEMVVGAPLHSPDSDSLDVGKVYVFMNKGSGSFEQTPLSLTGSAANKGRFGSTLARMYDLDRDGFEDFAVAAPYEDEGRGAVYIFHGAAGKMDTSPSQIIRARSLSESLKGFGMSISRGVDIDGNNHPDLAIGAYDSGSAVLLRTRPVVEIKSSLTASPSRIDTEAKQFQVQACLSYKGKAAPSNLVMNISIEITSLHAYSNFQIDGKNTKIANAVATMNQSISACSPFTVVLERERRVDFSKPIQISLYYNIVASGADVQTNETTFIDVSTLKRSSRVRRQTISSSSFNRVDSFCSNCPTVNTNMDNQRSIGLSVPFTVGCGSDAICQTDLRLTYEFPKRNSYDYVVGSQTELDILIKVVNFLEPASLPKLSIDVPLTTSPLRIPPACNEQVFSDHIGLQCDVRPHPFYNTSSYSLVLTLDMSILPTDVSRLRLNMSVTSTGEDITPSKSIVNATITLVREADIEIRGRTQEEFLSLKKSRQRNKSRHLRYVQHTYDILKYLASPVNAVNISFRIPAYVRFASGKLIRIVSLLPPTAYINAQPFQCISEDISYDDLASLRASKNVTDLSAGEPQAVKGADSGRTPQNKNNVIPLASSLFSASTNNTLTLDCRSPHSVMCARITCHSVPFLGKYDQATVILGMHLNVTALRPVLDRVDRVLLFTEGEAHIVDDSLLRSGVNMRPDLASVMTELATATPGSASIPVWIIIGSAIGAFFLLAVITFCLYMSGFFERKERDKMNHEQALHSNGFHK